jgi:hypothetical protein
MADNPKRIWQAQEYVTSAGISLCVRHRMRSPCGVVNDIELVLSRRAQASIPAPGLLSAISGLGKHIERRFMVEEASREDTPHSVVK